MAFGNGRIKSRALLWTEKLNLGGLDGPHGAGAEGISRKAAAADAIALHERHGPMVAR